MGIRFVSNSWRAPLRLINGWLPMPKGSFPSAKIPRPPFQGFVRAGWLGQSAASSSKETLASRVSHAPGVQTFKAVSTPPLRRSPLVCKRNARLVISGRLVDVCAELDRLAALESHT